MGTDKLWDNAPLDKLDQLPTPTLLRLYHGLHELIDQGAHRAIADILWARRGDKLEAWPTQPLSYLPQWVPSTDVKIISYCGKATGPADPEHRPTRMLTLEPEWCFSGYECSCGRRDHNHRGYDLDLHFKRQLSRPWAHVWSTKSIDGIPHFVVCKRAKHAEDIDHAPSTVGLTCICGGYMGDGNIDGRADKLLPVY